MILTTGKIPTDCQHSLTVLTASPKTAIKKYADYLKKVYLRSNGLVMVLYITVCHSSAFRLIMYITLHLSFDSTNPQNRINL